MISASDMSGGGVVERRLSSEEAGWGKIEDALADGVEGLNSDSTEILDSAAGDCAS